MSLEELMAKYAREEEESNKTGNGLTGQLVDSGWVDAVGDWFGTWADHKLPAVRLVHQVIAVVGEDAVRKALEELDGGCTK